MKNTVIYKQNKLFTLKADFYGVTSENAPVIIYIHGGGLLWGTREELTGKRSDSIDTTGK